MAKTEVVENKLQVMVREAGLEPTKARYIKEKFNDYFDIADEWTIKARAIKVTNANQTGDMAMAREGRLFLKEKRCAIETARKELKEQALREGKAIDGIANVLKALIVPIEDYLDKQEHFVEIQEEAKRETMRLEVEKRIEEERIAKEKADAEALDKARLENEKLKAEAEAREKKIALERKKQEALLAKERAEAEARRKEQEAKMAEERKKADIERKLVEEKARLEREKQEKTLANERAKAKRLKELAEEKAEADRIKAIAEKERLEAKARAERKEKERLEEVLKNQIECPFCHKKFNLKEK